MMVMHPIPPEFANRMIGMSGQAGRQWIAGLPDMLDEYAHRWSLTLGLPFALSYNYVAPVIREAGTEAVLKLGLPNRELLSQMYALQVFAEHGMVKLLEADFERQVFLLERIRPGVELVTVEDDDQRTRVAAQVMQQLWIPVTGDYPLLTVESWTAGLKKYSSPFP
jgi:streptomycin 6-kinase